MPSASPQPFFRRQNEAFSIERPVALYLGISHASTQRCRNQTSESLLTGILENILGKVLAAFQGRMSDLLGVTACKALSEDPALAVQMAAEPCAPQAGKTSSEALMLSLD